jgi:epoxyqueuosine reductase
MKSKIKNIIVDRSKELGFDRIGFADVETLNDEIQHYKEWTDMGYHAKMGWMERNSDKRENPRLILDSAKTVIATLTNYNTCFEHDNADGKISRYAWGSDYHEVILPKLKELAQTINEIDPGAESRCYVDTGPILEKVWAEKAGLGWIGKNGLLINKDFGSWAFIGIIISSIEIEADRPHKNLCGKCTDCLQSCPTGAIIKPKVIDSNKCLSYWTIESKHEPEIPAHIIDNSNGWAFGCDICQEICPWNKKFSRYTSDSLYAPREGETSFRSKALENMTKQEFALRYRKSPIKRTKLEGILRNIKAFMQQ